MYTIEFKEHIYLQRLDNGRIIVHSLSHHTLPQPLAIKVVLGHAERSLEAPWHEGLELVVPVFVGAMVRMVVPVVLAAH